ncbi:hypothetical protein TCAL_01157 [Tigriopus californicus]|uniref:Uncharacterized protein n=1 Tax=Tigriopus californicus TaxID=6832 RepID=A0A553P4U5_TIGCA|nr:hypothetical protein TCAL_01157 [Tigriopus californicus]
MPVKRHRLRLYGEQHVSRDLSFVPSCFAQSKPGRETERGQSKDGRRNIQGLVGASSFEGKLLRERSKRLDGSHCSPFGEPRSGIP